MSHHFIVFGSINMDVVVRAARLPEAGETVMGDDAVLTPGGKGANQAVAAARLGASVRMVGRVGADAFGPTLLSSLADNGVDTAGIAVDPDNPSGTAIILLDGEGQNRIIVVPGANAVCGEVELDTVSRFLSDGDEALLLQMEIPLDVSLAAARIAREKGRVLTVLDSAPPQPLDREALSLIDVLTPNQSEAEFLTGIPVTSPSSGLRAARKLRDMGAATVIVKLGEQGAVFASPADEGHIPAFPVDVVDTVAAGDAFGAALAVAFCESRDFPSAVRFAVAAGALAVTRPGAQSAMPTIAAVRTLMGS